MVQYRAAKLFITGRSELRKILFFLALSVTFLFVYEMSRKQLNGFAPNSQGTCFIPSSDEFECQLGQRSKVKVTREKQHFRPFRQPACGLCLVKHL